MNNDYYTILPAKVRYDTKLPPNAKILFSELLALCGDKGFCWASNGYLARLYGVDKMTISRWISMLNKRGYIFFEPIDKKINTIEEKINEARQIYIPPIDKKVYQNKKNNNNKNNKTRGRAHDIAAYDLEKFEEMINKK